MSDKLNIAKNMIDGDCNLKCNYRFDYPRGGPLPLGNLGGGGFLIEYAESKPKLAPVIYNGNHYDVSVVSIMAPWPFFKIRGVYPKGMITIVHQPRLEGVPLMVFVPIDYGSPDNAGGLISDILVSGMRQAPDPGSKTTLNLTNNSLNIIVPKQPFFSFQINNTGLAFVIFDKGASVNYSVLYKFMVMVHGKTFKKSPSAFIKKLNDNTPAFVSQKDGTMFYNKEGAKGITNGSGDDVYIVCEPTGQADDNVFVKMEDYAEEAGFSFDTDIIKNPWFQAFLLFIGILLLYAIVFGLMKYLKPTNADVKTGGTSEIFGKKANIG